MLVLVSLLFSAIFGLNSAPAASGSGETGVPVASGFSRTSQRPPSRPAPSRPAPKDPFFTSNIPVEQLRNKQAVLETSQGAIVLDLLADAAPTHVAHFITRAREGAYDGTTFHRVIPM